MSSALLPGIVACSCGTKLKVPENPVVKALKCPRCSNVVRLGATAVPAAKPSASPAAPARKPATPTPAAPPASKAAAAPPTMAAPGAVPASAKRAVPPPPPAEEEEILVNEAVDEEEVVVNEAVDEEEVEVNEAVDDEPAPKKSKKAAHGLKPVAEGEDPFEGLDIPEKMQAGIRAEVGKKEKIIWVGRPDVALMVAQARPAIYVGIFLILLGLGCLVSLAFVKTESIFVTVRIIFGCVVLLFGVVFLLVPMLLEKTQAGRACYILTNRRAILYNTAGGGTRSYNSLKLGNMERKEISGGRFKGYGDLVFEVETTWDNTGHGTRERAVERKQNHGFLQIAQVRAVEKLVRETLIDREDD